MNELKNLKKEKLKDIKLVVFDLDGVLVPRGTKIRQNKNVTTLETKKIKREQVEQIKNLNNLGIKINISSGRGLYMLQEMFREVLDFVSLTYENGSATWLTGKIYQHVDSYNNLKKIIFELTKIKDKRIKGFEPKEFIITIHCKSRVEKIEKIVSKYKELYTIWNGEAYDIGIKDKQTKAVGLKKLMEIFKLKKKNILIIGDNYNDKEIFSKAGIRISSDKTRLKGDYYVPLKGKFLPADLLMQHLLRELKK